MSEKRTDWHVSDSSIPSQTPEERLEQVKAEEQEKADWHFSWGCKCKDKAHPSSEPACPTCGVINPLNK